MLILFVLHPHLSLHLQGGFPEEPVDIYVSPMMERLLEVDDKNYRFENVVYLYLSWRDPSAFQKMKDSTDVSVISVPVL